MAIYALHNGSLADALGVQLLLNRGLFYGDRFFDTIIFRNQVLEDWESHLERIRASARLLRFDNIVEKTSVSWQEELLTLIRANTANNESCRIRLVVVRQEGGLYRPQKKEADYYAETTPLAVSLPTVVRVDFATSVHTCPTSYSPYKINTLPYVLAGLEATERSLDDLILCSADGFVSEAISSNLFWSSGGVFYTPALQTGCVAGIARKNIINHLKDTQQSIIEGFFEPDVLLQAQFVWLSNVVGVRSISQIGCQTFETAPFLVQGNP